MDSLKPLLEQLSKDVSEMKTDVKDLVKQSAVHNYQLETHEARSLALQAEQKAQALRMEPVQRHVAFVNGLGKVALAVLVAALIKLVSGLL